VGTTKAYESEGVVIHFDARRCIHAAKCVAGLPEVFDAERRPWIDATKGSVEEIVRVVERCPSGALTHERRDGGAPEVAPSGPPRIKTVTDGPLYVLGAVEVCDDEGTPVHTGPRMALCRCGASNNKPFCDNSHLAIGFTDTK